MDSIVTIGPNVTLTAPGGETVAHWSGGEHEAEGNVIAFFFRPALVELPAMSLSLGAFSHVALSGALHVSRGSAGFTVTTPHGEPGYLTHAGGPLEDRGRLRYIDGCSDTLLISPVRLGMACFNHLHFPPGIRQTMHTHPSVRIGAVVRGSGVCVQPCGNTKLEPGMVWILPAGSEHCFHTPAEGMDVVAWHPDSDFGPTDDNHPMVNRTMVGGVSAAGIDAIRTREIVQ